jgi:hypothetical protein
VPFLPKLRTALEYLRKPITLPKPLFPEVTTELELLNRLLADRALTDTCRAFGLNRTDLVLLAKELAEVPQTSATTLPAIRASELTAASAGATGTLNTRQLRQENLLAFLITRGSLSTRQAIERMGMPPAALLFWLAHREHEPALRALWPWEFPSGARLAVRNDPYTPMEVALSCLSEAFNLSKENAIQLMLRVHQEGEVHLDYPATSSAVEFCEECNRKWRSIPVPLYIRPVAL